MADYQLTCCSTADMPQEYFDRRNIKYVCFHFTMDGVQYDDDLGKSMPFDEFYARVAAGSMPTTSQVNVEEFINFFEPMLKAGQDILHISFSSGLSGESNAAQIAVGELRARYPERHILALDSLGASSGYGLLVDAGGGSARLGRHNRRGICLGAGQSSSRTSLVLLDGSNSLQAWRTHIGHVSRAGRHVQHLPAAQHEF